MAREYIVVPVVDGPITAIALGMLYAEHSAIPYPIGGEVLYAWHPHKPKIQPATLVAFGPLDSLNDKPEFGKWCLGRKLTTSVGELAIPDEAVLLEDEWFASPPP